LLYSLANEVVKGAKCPKEARKVDSLGEREIPEVALKEKKAQKRRISRNLPGKTRAGEDRKVFPGAGSWKETRAQERYRRDQLSDLQGGETPEKKRRRHLNKGTL